MVGSLLSPDTMGLHFVDMGASETQQAMFRWLQRPHSFAQVPPDSFANAPTARDLLHLKLHGANLGLTDLPSMGNFQVTADEFASNFNIGLASLDDTVDGCISRTSSCKMIEEEGIAKSESIAAPNNKKNKRLSGTDSGEVSRVKKIKREVNSGTTGKEKSLNNRTQGSSDTSKEHSKSSDVQKPDYIHVRARRGEATDKHSLAERARREKISKKMKYLQDLVPGCNKITGKAGMLDEIINYVQSLQRQVEFLSMKLAVMNPSLGFGFEGNDSKLLPSYPAKFTSTPNPGDAMDCLASSSALDIPLLNLNHGETADTVSNKIQSSSTWEARQLSHYNHPSFGYQY